MLIDEFWAVTSDFNPAGYRRRSDNFTSFHESLYAPRVGIGRFMEEYFHSRREDGRVEALL